MGFRLFIEDLSGFFQQYCRIAKRDFSRWKNRIQKLSHPAAIVSQHGFPDRHSLQHGAPEGLRLLRERADDIGNAHDFADVAAVTEKSDILRQTHLREQRFQFGEVILLLRMRISGDQAVNVTALLLEGSDQPEKITVPLEPGDPSRQQQRDLSDEMREIRPPLR
jgi:hypothetical protein